jgi:Ca2+/Na+ antiporter
LGWNLAISVRSNGMPCLISILFLMIVILVFALIASDWKMNKLFGIVMLVAYAGFCVAGILIEKSVIKCPFGSFTCYHTNT